MQQTHLSEPDHTWTDTSYSHLERWLADVWDAAADIPHTNHDPKQDDGDDQ